MTMKTTTKTLLLMAVLSCCVQVAWGQTEKMLELINSRGSYFPLMQWLEDESHAEGYIRQLHDFSLQSMRKTLEAVQEERKDAQTILIARKEILGAKLVGKLDSKPKQKDLDKQDEILKERFNEVDRLKKTFDKAKTTDRLCAMLESAINSELNTRQPATMPGGSLKRFEYSTGNGYSGFHLEIFLGKKEGANVLRVEEKRMRFEPDEKEPVVYDVVVDDSVFVKVRDMVEKGQLYDVGRWYMPDFMIFDASNWSFSISFENGSISSSGYASGPDHSDTLGQINQYLMGLYNALKPQTPDDKEPPSPMPGQ